MISYAIPIAGSKNMYTSGWNVNQNKCWYAIGSPPIAGLKNPVIPNLSVYIIIIAAENVGMAIIIWKDWTNIPQANNDIFIIGRSGCLHLRIVTTKFTDPRIEEIPSIFIPKIHISVAGPAERITEYGG